MIERKISDSQRRAMFARLHSIRRAKFSSGKFGTHSSTMLANSVKDSIKSKYKVEGFCADVVAKAIAKRRNPTDQVVFYTRVGRDKETKGTYDHVALLDRRGRVVADSWKSKYDVKSKMYKGKGIGTGKQEKWRTVSTTKAEKFLKEQDLLERKRRRLLSKLRVRL